MKLHSSNIPLEWLICPMTKEKLQYSKDTLESSRFVYHRHPLYKYWDFIPQKAQFTEKPEWKIWKHLQENGLISYSADPEHNLGVGYREDFIQFADFCSFRGNVLDIGVGPQRIPTHMEYCSKKGVFFVGLDPLEGEQPKAFAYVKGLGEYLPFKNDLFDQVLFVTSIDHFIYPQMPLREALRVMKVGGELCIWIGEKDKSAPKPQQTFDWYESLSVPKGAEDRFHYRRLNSYQMEELILKSNLKIKRKEVVSVDKWRRNLFYGLEK